MDLLFMVLFKTLKGLKINLIQTIITATTKF